MNYVQKEMLRINQIFNVIYYKKKKEIWDQNFLKL